MPLLQLNLIRNPFRVLLAFSQKVFNNFVKQCACCWAGKGFIYIHLISVVVLKLEQAEFFSDSFGSRQFRRRRHSGCRTELSMRFVIVSSVCAWRPNELLVQSIIMRNAYQHQSDEIEKRETKVAAAVVWVRDDCGASCQLAALRRKWHLSVLLAKHSHK